MNKKHIQAIIITLLIAIWTVSFNKTPLYGFLNGLYFSIYLLMILYFDRKYTRILGLAVISQSILFSSLMLAGYKSTEAFLYLGAEPLILIVALALSLFNILKIDKTSSLSGGNALMLASLVIFTTLGISESSKSGILPLMYTIILPLVSTIFLVLRINEFHVLVIFQAIIGIYIGTMQIYLGEYPYLTIITNIILLSASLFRYSDIIAKRKIEESSKLSINNIAHK